MKTIRILSLAAVATMVATLAACSEGKPTAQQVEQQKAQQNQASLNVTDPIPVLPMSQERKNLIKRAKRINVQNMTSCITLFANNGAVVGFFPVAGKVSSLNSYLLSGDQVIYDRGEYGGGNIVMEQPDIDGAYGKNADGIFFFTADTDAYVEWMGSYFWSDQCLTPSVQPLLLNVAPADK